MVTPPDRPRNGPGELRRELLSHARDLLQLSGPEAVSVRNLGRRAGRSAQAVYTAFGGRPALIRALCTDGHAELAQVLVACPTSRSPILDLFVQVQAYLTWARDNLHHYHLMTTNDPDASTHADDRIRLTYGPVEAILMISIERVIATGTVRSPEPRYLYLQLAAAIHGAALLALESRTRGQGAPEGSIGLELTANLLIALGSNRTTTHRALLRAQSKS